MYLSVVVALVCFNAHPNLSHALVVVVLNPSHGSTPSRSNSIRVLTTGIIRESPVPLRSRYMDIDNAMRKFALPDIAIVDNNCNRFAASSSSSAATETIDERRITIPKLATAAAFTALAIFTLPTASNAISIPPTIATTSTAITSLTDSGFYQAFSLVLLSEIGDKTFFVAALLAAKLSRLISFVGSLGALAVMTVISVIIGQVFHAVPSEIANGVPLDDVAAVLAFTYFGIKILSEALFDDVGERGGKSAMDEEFEEAEETVEGSDTINKASPG